MIPYLIGAALLGGAMAAKRAQDVRRAEQAITEHVPSQSSDWQGNMWDRLDGSDLVAQNARNRYSMHASMDPSAVDRGDLRKGYRPGAVKQPRNAQQGGGFDLDAPDTNGRKPIRPRQAARGRGKGARR